MITAPDATGDIYVAGLFTTYNGQPVGPVVRIRPDGTLNESFTLAAEITGITTLAPADDGSRDIYVGSQVTVWANFSTDFQGRIWKVNADGSVDSSFPRGDLIAAPDPILHGRINTIVAVGDGSGRAYVCGVFDRYNGVAVPPLVRVTPTGTLDPTFQSAAGNPNFGEGTFTVVPADDSSGDLYVMNRVIQDINGPDVVSTDVYRLNADGSRDPAFQRFTTIQFGTVRAVLPVGDGSGDIFIGGMNIVNGTSPPTSPANNPSAFSSLVRVNPDGSLDLASPKPALIDPSAVTVTAMVRAVDGTRDVLIATAGHLMRFKADMSTDPAFIVGTGQPGLGIGIDILLPATDGTGDLYAGGSVTTYNGVPAGNIVRLNGNGTLDGT